MELLCEKEMANKTAWGQVTKGCSHSFCLVRLTCNLAV